MGLDGGGSGAGRGLGKSKQRQSLRLMIGMFPLILTVLNRDYSGIIIGVP